MESLWASLLPRQYNFHRVLTLLVRSLRSGCCCVIFLSCLLRFRSCAILLLLELNSLD